MIDTEWDEQKNQRNKRRRGLSFETAELVFDDPYARMEENRVVEGEQRFWTVVWSEISF
jgi:uncharacterized protein